MPPKCLEDHDSHDTILDEALSNIKGIEECLKVLSNQFGTSVEKEIDKYKDYREQCDKLLTERKEVIQELSASHPKHAAQLPTSTEFDTAGVLFRHKGVLCSLKPVPKYIAPAEPTPVSDDASDIFEFSAPWQS